MLILNHAGAVDMARLALIHGRDSVVRQIAEEIIASQTVEIADTVALLPDAATLITVENVVIDAGRMTLNYTVPVC